MMMATRNKVKEFKMNQQEIQRKRDYSTDIGVENEA